MLELMKHCILSTQTGNASALNEAAVLGSLCRVVHSDTDTNYPQCHVKCAVQVTCWRVWEYRRGTLGKG